MTRKLFLLASSLLVLSFKFDKKAEKSINILFIGNDMTSYNDMPKILQEMLNREANNYVVSQSTFFNIPLNQHFTKKLTETKVGGTKFVPLQYGDTSVSEKKIKSRVWDYVVLQDMTTQLLIPEAKIYQVIPTIKYLQNKYRTNVAEFVLFGTWPNSDTFPKQYCYQNPDLERIVGKYDYCTPLINSLDEECFMINKNYDTVSKATNISNLPVANYFAEVIKHHSNISLYDGIEPSIYAAYLNACIFFRHITKQKAAKIKYTANLDEATALTIQKVVDDNFPK